MKHRTMLFLTCFLAAVSVCRAAVVYQSREGMWDTWVLQDGEVYINDRWIFNVGLKGIPVAGDFSLLVESGGAQVHNLEIHELEPLVLRKQE